MGDHPTGGADPRSDAVGNSRRLLGRRVFLRSMASAVTLAVVSACRRAEPAAGVTTLSDGSATTTSATAPTTSTTATTTSTTAPTTSTTAPTTTTTSPTTTSPTTTTTTTTATVTDPPQSTIDEGARPPSSFDRDALYVALYGFPGSSVLGALGEQDADSGALRAREVAAAYQGFDRRVVPTFEIIASVASSEAGGDGDYSNEHSMSRFEPHLAVAAANDMHVVFDLQPGRSRFPDQAREFEALWLHPHASIALDPEWRVGPDQRPGGGRIGSVGAAEVNETIDYVDALITAHGLPAKLCIVHQFDPSMITDKQLIRGTDNVQVLIQMDGFGTLEQKRGTWGRVVADLPPDALTGWKNFYDEDRPTPTPAQTMANRPAPSFVSFQ